MHGRKHDTANIGYEQEAILNKVTAPGTALNQLLIAILLTWLCYRWASTPGWEAAWLLFIACASYVVSSFRGLLQAHHAWKIKNELVQEAHKSSGRYDTRQDNGEKRDDNWE